MTLRRRLTLWYGGLLAVALTVAFALAYLLHTEGHDADVDAALADLAGRAQVVIGEQIDAGIPLRSVDLRALHEAIDEPHAVWLVVDDRVVASAGTANDPAFVAAAVTALAPGWHDNWTVDGRTRTYSAATPIGRIVVAAQLGAIDAANAELRLTLSLLGIFGVGIGAALASGLAGFALRPVARLTETARTIAATRDFSKRVRIHGDPEDELVVLASTFDEMLTSLDDAYRQQQRFLGDVSHELRTPLTTIRGHAELLASGELGPDARHEALVRIERESARLARLIDELLTLARAEAAERFAPRPVQLDELVMETFEEFRPLADGRLRIRWIEAAVVNGERDRLKQLVVALVDNALRYTPAPGRVDVSLSDDGRDAVLRVEDEGIGIDDADLPKVFDRFYRADAARRVSSSGSGLGLAIVRWILQRHGGSITLERREEGRGTRATARVPLAAARAVATAAPAARVAAAS